MEFLKDVGIWIWSVIRIWQAYMTGGIVIACWVAYERFTNKTISLRTFRFGVAAFLLVAFFMAWQQQYRGKQKSEQELGTLQQQQKLDLKVDLEQTSTGVSGDKVVVVVGAAIVNRGAPTSVHAITLNLVLVDGRKVSVVPTLIPDNFRMRGPSYVIVLDEKDNLVIKVGSLMQRGEGRPGSVLFVLPSAMKRGDLDGAKFTLSCRDYLDEIFTSSENTFPGQRMIDEPKVFR